MSEPTSSSSSTPQDPSQPQATPSASPATTGGIAQQRRASTNLADSSDARTAQFTLLSILLGVILTALLTGLPGGASAFAINLLHHGLGISLRALAVVLTAALLWLEYTWGILTHFVTATPAHNLSYFTLAIALSGVALTVADFRAWMGWIAGLAGIAVVSGIINHPKPRTELLRKYYQKYLKVLDIVELTLYVSVFVATLAFSLAEYLWTPTFVTPQVQVVCSACVLAAVVCDFLMQVMLYIPRLRKAPVPTDNST